MGDETKPGQQGVTGDEAKPGHSFGQDAGSVATLNFSYPDILFIYPEILSKEPEILCPDILS